MRISTPSIYTTPLNGSDSTEYNCNSAPFTAERDQSHRYSTRSSGEFIGDSPAARLEMFLRAIARPLMAKVKQTTGIVGLDVVPNAREVLINLYNKTLKEIQAVPEDEGYRKAVESFTRHRLKVCQEEEDWEMIEKKLGCGQVEELIEEAQDELKLIEKMIEWDPWGVPDDYECEVIENDAPVPKHVPLHRPGPLPEEFYKTLEALQAKGSPAVTSGQPELKE